jgi:type IV secretory pathway VirB6-like protein
MHLQDKKIYEVHQYKKMIQSQQITRNRIKLSKDYRFSNTLFYEIIINILKHIHLIHLRFLNSFFHKKILYIKSAFRIVQIFLLTIHYLFFNYKVYGNLRNSILNNRSKPYI